MTASNGQHRSLSAAAAARKYEYVFPGFSFFFVNKQWPTPNTLAT